MRRASEVKTNLQRVIKLINQVYKSANTQRFATGLRVSRATAQREARISQKALSILFFIFSYVDCASFMCDWNKPR